MGRFLLPDSLNGYFSVFTQFFIELFILTGGLKYGEYPRVQLYLATCTTVLKSSWLFDITPSKIA
jgi:hypothetical protein